MRAMMKFGFQVQADKWELQLQMSPIHLHLNC